MKMSQNGLTLKSSHAGSNLLISLGLFFLALLPRAYDLSRFVTADEAKWVYRSAQFLVAVLQGEWAATSINLTPAVTTTWLGSLGLAIHYQLNQAALHVPLVTWLESLPEFRTELDVLVATRWPMIILGSLFVVGLFWLVRALINAPVALIAAIFVAFDPHQVALSRILGHDAVVTIFMSSSLLLLLLAVRDGSDPSGPRTLPTLALSGMAAGLAFLSKAPALFLMPFAGLIFLGKIWLDRPHLMGWLGRFGLWAAVAYLTFTVVWPAAWVDPLGRPLAVVENAFLSATDVDEADDENYWLVPNLGPFYYLVHGGFKLSPLVAAGLTLIIILRIQRTRRPISQPRNLLITRSPSSTPWLVAFILLFTFFLTLSTKRSPRYILPVFPTLAILAAGGWFGLYRMVAHNLNVPSIKSYGLRFLFYPILALSALLTVMPFAPYYFTYFNPLLGGPLTAPKWVKLGWGEGLDHVGRFLERVDPDSRVGTAYSSTVAPYFEGDLSSLDGDRLDYVVLYAKQVQSGGSPLLPEVITYYRQTDPIYTVNLNGIRYADIYPGPAVQLRPNGAIASQSGGPLGFRLGEPYGRIGQPLAVDLLWRANDRPRQGQLVLETVAAGQPVVVAADLGKFEQIAENLYLSRQTLTIPPDAGRGCYSLRFDEVLLGEVDLRRFDTPSDLAPVVESVFAEQVAITGYKFGFSEDYVRVRLAWQAQASRLPDYTVFVQLIDPERNERLAGVDTMPQDGAWPTSRWVKGEVVTDEYLVAVPPGLRAEALLIIVGLYTPQTGQRLTLPTGQDHWMLPWTIIREE